MALSPSPVRPVLVVGSRDNATTVGQGICGSMNGCVGVYSHPTTGSNTACVAIFGSTSYYNAGP
jgi:hypothetical protein